MIKYRLKFLCNQDDSQPKFHYSPEPLSVGDVIEIENGDFHCVVNLQTQKTGVRADLSEAALNPELARLLAEQRKRP